MNTNSTAPPAIDMIERAAFVLRGSPAAVWAVYAAGAVPLFLTALYFVFDVTSVAEDDSRWAAEALLCALCFLWFNVCRARFAQVLLGSLSDQPPERWKRSLDPLNLAVQSVKLFAMPFAALAVIPLGWTVAFFRNSAIFAGRGAVRHATASAVRWPRQTWLALGILALFYIVVFINLFLLLAILPEMVKIFSGVDNEYTRLGFNMNATVPAVAAGLAWLILDPLYQAFFCVHAFLSESRETGIDLMVALRHLALLLLVALVTVPHAVAQAPVAGISAHDLDRSVEKVLEQREYAWHLPVAHDARPGFIDRMLSPVLSAFRRSVRWIGDLLDRWFRSSQAADPAGKPGRFGPVQWTVVALLVLLTAVSGFALVRFLHSARTPGDALPPQAPRIVRLDDEQISAADLPEDQWIELGRQCLARGDYRHALRAFYLANLAWLGRRQLLTIAPFKSNRDYGRELRRRARSEALQYAFSDNVRAFERGWYGTHDVDAQQVGEFEKTFSRMKSDAEA